MPITDPVTIVDVRRIAGRDRHPMIFSTFRGLAAGQAMELVNDHDPVPLYHHFQAELPGKFGWDYLQRGPDIWRVAISRLAPRHGDGQCCGGCGGD